MCKSCATTKICMKLLCGQSHCKSCILLECYLSDKIQINNNTILCVCSCKVESIIKKEELYLSNDDSKLYCDECRTFERINYCADCKAWWCAQCFLVHDSQKIYANHSITSVSGNECGICKKIKQADIWCKDCIMYICVDCDLSHINCAKIRGIFFINYMHNYEDKIKEVFNSVNEIYGKPIRDKCIEEYANQCIDKLENIIENSNKIKQK